MSGQFPCRRVFARRSEGRHAPALYDIVAIALHQCGLWQDALATLDLKSRHHPRGADDWYDVACFCAKAGRTGQALLALQTALCGSRFYQRRALEDTDLQPLWPRLAQVQLTPAMILALVSGALSDSAKLNLEANSACTWDPSDRASVPSSFRPWMTFNAATLNLEMVATAPAQCRKRFKAWKLGRARATQRLMRRAMQRAKSLVGELPAGAGLPRLFEPADDDET